MPKRDELGRTVPASAFATVGTDREASPTPMESPGRDDLPTLERVSIAGRLRELGLPMPPVRPRFEIGPVLGMGATARVFAVVDRDLERPVAVKLLASSERDPREVERFVEEARITAALDHPNVLPVHDLEVNSRGQVYFTMKRIDGRSLGAAIEQSSPTRRLPPLDDPNALVSVVIGVCQALAYAHRRRIVHQDVKPDNVMLGDFGEVILVDWGSATRLERSERSLYGTPLYMSPEQARTERADERSDVYCVGAMLFHALTLRVPTWNEDLEVFWRRKRAGEIDAPTLEERAAAPPALLAIALKALAARPEDRYADAGALLEDLRRYQGGLAVTALRESALARLRRWHRRHWRTAWGWAAAAVALIALGAALYGQRLEAMARWGAPVVAESFADGSWQARWKPLAGSFSTRDGRLVSDQQSDILVCTTPVRGAAAIEYEAEVLPGAHLGDISVVWARDLRWNESHDRVEKLIDAYYAQVGAWDGAYSIIARHEDPSSRTLAYSDFRPEPGRRFRVRVEVVDDRISLAVDGRPLCAWVDPLPLEGGYVAIYATYAGKAYGDLRIYERRPPLKLPATAVGDALARGATAITDDPKARERELERAAWEYRRVGQSYPDQRLGREACYKEGLCRWWQNRHADALQTWTGIRGAEHEGDVRLHEAEDAFAAGDHDRVLAILAEVAGRGDADLRTRAALLWGQWLLAFAAPQSAALADRYLALRRAAFPGESVVDQAEAQALVALHRYQEVLDRFPRQRSCCCDALTGLWRYHEVIDRYPEQRWPCIFASFMGGIWEHLEVADDVPGLYAETLWMRGRADEVIAEFPQMRGVVVHSLRVSGRLDQILRDYQDQPEDCAFALCALGRLDEARAMTQDVGKYQADLATGEVAELLGSDSADTHQRATAITAVECAIGGDLARAETLTHEADTWEWVPFEPALNVHLLVPFIQAMRQADPTRYARAVAALEPRWRWVFRQQLWHVLAYIDGRIDDHAFLAQPECVFAPSNLHLVRAIRADLAGRGAEALAEWTRFRDTPLWSRSEVLDSGPQRVAEWRIRQLTR
jgi:hypothetical protein